MSTVAEIEAALPLLNEEELKRVEAALERARKEHEQQRAGGEDRLRAFEELQASLNLDEQKVAEWKALIRDARR